MNRLSRRLARLTSQRGFTLVEVLVASIVLVVGLLMISQAFASAIGRVNDSGVRTILHEVATQELERIRGMEYTQVATQNGTIIPTGNLLDDEWRVVSNVIVHIHRDIKYQKDPAYPAGGAYPANYRRVAISVGAVDQTGSTTLRSGIQAVELVSNVAGGAQGGTLDITVTDADGSVPLEDALITVKNTHLVPNVNMHSSSIKTDSDGRMILPGLIPDTTPNYVVSVTKTGYNTAYSDPVVVLDGLPYTVVQLEIGRISTMIIQVVDTLGAEVNNLNLQVSGPSDGVTAYSWTGTSTAGGVTLYPLRYSTDLDPYLVKLTSNPGYDSQEIKVILEPGTTQTVVITVPAGGGTTTTSSTTTTTTVSSTTTSSSTTTTVSASSTTTLKSSLRVYVEHNDDPLKDAWVTLSNGRSGKTTQDGSVFFDNLAPGSYGYTVQKNNYHEESGTVVVSGATSLSVDLHH